MNPSVKLDRFRDKIAVVTGGAQGIGRATVERMAIEGGKVFIVDRAEEAARATAKALCADGLDVDVAIADMATWAGASRVIDDIVALAGRIDVLVNNVGGTIWIKPFVEYTEDEIKAEMDRSLWPTIWACRAVIPHMIARKSGSIVLFDQANSEVARWNFVDAWPSKVTGPQAKADGNEVAIEELTLAHEGLERVK